MLLFSIKNDLMLSLSGGLIVASPCHVVMLP